MAPVARCRRRLQLNWRRARAWKPPSATPRPGSAPRSHRPTVSASVTATGRSIIFTGFTDGDLPELAARSGNPFPSCSPKETSLSPEAIRLKITSCDEHGSFGAEHPRPRHGGIVFQPWRYHMGEVVQFIPKRDLERP